MEAPALAVRGLSLTSGSRVLQRDLDFEVDRGRFLAVVGETGAGRRALLRSLVGLEAPAAGDVLVSGTGLWSATEAERARLREGFGILLAGGALLAIKTLLENVALPLRVRTHLRPRDVVDVARLKLALVGLAGYEHHYPAEVDEPRRVCAGLARATALDPGILFCERPTDGLDPISAARVRDSILRARDLLGTTVVVVSNDVRMVLAADEAVFLDMESKSMKARGNPARLRAESDDPEIRAFLQGPSE
jgi:phospholipid/cholesterol/gamma-HCH transport system ATP-binding protein